MLRITSTLKSKSPISFSAPIQSTRETGEGHDAFENRTWRERLHVNEEGFVFIPPMALKNCLTEVAQYLGESVPGKGKATYTKHFTAGIMVIDPMILPVEAENIKGEHLYVPADGRRGGSKRVWKTFPVVPQWEVDATIYALDPILIDKPEKIHEYLKHAGMFIGMGRFRPRNNGYYGRFDVVSFAYEKVSA